MNSLLTEIVMETEAEAGEPLSAPEPSARYPVVGVFVGFNAAGEPMVDFRFNASGSFLAARSITPLTEADAGREAVLEFEQGDWTRPLVMGLIEAPRRREASSSAAVAGDSETLVFSAEKELVLRCGSASIVLTRSGKVVIKGAYVVTRSSGTNRIEGGSVQIN
jgi:uncharacterized protein DUF6484